MKTVSMMLWQMRKRWSQLMGQGATCHMAAVVLLTAASGVSSLTPFNFLIWKDTMNIVQKST